jgi:hypothetical protein
MFEFINKLFKKEKKEIVVEKPLQRIDIGFIIETLESWEDFNMFINFCTANNITMDCNDVEKDDSYEQTNYKLKIIASDLLYKLNISINHFQLMRINKVKEWVAKQEKMQEKYGIS